MEKQKYSIIFKVISWVLMIISIAVVVWGSVVGYPKTVAADNGTVDPLLYWTYIMIGLALCAVIIVGLIRVSSRCFLWLWQPPSSSASPT